MIIEHLLNKLRNATTFDLDIREEDGRALIAFDAPYTWSDGSEKLVALWVDFNPQTKEITKFRLYGDNLQQALGYAYINHKYLWCKVENYNVEGMNDYPPFITLFPVSEETPELPRTSATTIDDLLAQFSSDMIDRILDDIPGKTLVTFKKPYKYQDCDDGIMQFLAIYDLGTRAVKAIKFNGLNMRTMLKYVKEHDHFFWCPIIHYTQDVFSSAPTITIITYPSSG